MIKHIVQKKRVVIRDEDIPFDEERWKTIMRHVLGRHYTDLQGDGPAWSFAHHHWDTFAKLIQDDTTPATVVPPTTNSVCTQTEPSSSVPVCTQTDNNNDDHTHHTYKHNVDENLRSFVEEWARQHNLEINQV